jgi:hypothetical protein
MKTMRWEELCACMEHTIGQLEQCEMGSKWYKGRLETPAGGRSSRTIQFTGQNGNFIPFPV